MGKGSRRRPMTVDRKTFSDNWDRIFKRRRQVRIETDDYVVIGPVENVEADLAKPFSIAGPATVSKIKEDS